MRSIGTALALLLAPLAAQAAEWTRMSNARYGFAIDIPAAYRPSPPPENGDGLRFTSPDGRSEIAAYGHMMDDAGGMRGDAGREAGFEAQDGVRLTYRQVSDTAYTISGLKGDRIVYIHAVTTCGGSGAALVRVDYPAADKPRMDPTITRLARTLRGSKAC